MGSTKENGGYGTERTVDFLVEWDPLAVAIVYLLLSYTNTLFAPYGFFRFFTQSTSLVRYDDRYDPVVTTRHR